MFDVFEHPWGLVAAGGIVMLILLILRSVAPEKCRWWLWLLPFVLAFAAFGFDYLVETDREKINAVIDTGVKAVEGEDPDTIEVIVADDYADSYHRSKSSLMAHCRDVLSEPFAEKNIKRIVSIDIQGPKASIIFTVRVLFDKQSYIYQSFKQQMLVEVQAALGKQPDGGWLISRVELLKLDFQPAKWQTIKQASQ